MQPLLLNLYRTISGWSEPLLPFVLQRRARSGKEDIARLDERLGRASLERPDGDLVWLHGVSVGESLSLLPLIAAITRDHPEVQILVTSATRTSADLMGQRLPRGVIHQYAPVDAPGAVARFLAHWRPGLGLFVESELWPNLILQAKASGVRLGLVSARMTEESFQGWFKRRAAAKTLLQTFDLILPQDRATASRLERLGARLGPGLNLKTLGAPLPCDAGELEALSVQLAGRKVILAASTHPGEDALIARAYAEAGVAKGLLVIAPRHPDRGVEIAAELTTMGFQVARRSQSDPIVPATTAYLADSLGEMGLLFRLADVAIMGGSFVPGIGGHNPLEPALLGPAIVVGPHTFNASEVYEDLIARVGAILAQDERALARHIRGLCQYADIGDQVSQAALAYALQQGDALDQALRLISPMMARP